MLFFVHTSLLLPFPPAIRPHPMEPGTPNQPPQACYGPSCPTHVLAWTIPLLQPMPASIPQTCPWLPDNISVHLKTHLTKRPLQRSDTHITPQRHVKKA